MKRISFLQVVVLAVLAVSAASCGTPMGTSGDYYEEAPVRSNVYYYDPYYGSPNTIIVERNPYTGQYYHVQPRGYGNVYGAPVYPNNRRSNRVYNNGNYNSNRNYNSGRNNTLRRSYPQTRQPQQTPAQRQQKEQQREQAKESILGRKRN